jgi:protoporphyrinogen oxidase
VTEASGHRWGVVGGGVLGLTLALRLAQRGHSVTVFERAPKIGGLASAWRLGDIVWDRHYHVILLSDTYTRSLLGELGLEHEMKWVETRTGFFTNGEFHSMSNSIEFLQFPPLDIVSKVRLASTIFYASKIKNWRRLENIPVADWLRRWSGKRTFEKIWLPLLKSKLGESYAKTSAAFIWATIARMYAARRSGLKREMFGYIPGGYARIFDAFKKRLSQANVELALGTDITKVVSDSSGKTRIVTADGNSVPLDRVVLTVPAPAAAKLCPDLSDSERDLLDGIEYQGIVCASVLLDRPLGGYYITNITDSWVPFTAVIEMSACVDRGQFGGHHLAYLPRYLASTDPEFNISDEEWRDRFVKGLSRMYPDLREDQILSFRISRERYVYALSTLGYSRRLPPKKTSLPGVFLVNTAHVVNGTLNVNETLTLAEESMPLLVGADEETKAGET